MGPASPQYQTLLQEIDRAIRANQIERACVLAEAALSVGPEHPKLLNLAAYRMFDRGMTDRGIALLQRASALAPRDAMILNDLGSALRRTGQMQAALEALDRAIALDPRFAQAHGNRGLVLEALSRPEAAKAAYERAVAVEPGNADVVVGLARLAVARGDYDDALAYRDRLTARGVTSGLPPDALDLSLVAHARGDFAAAKRLATTLFARDNDPEAGLAIARAGFGAGDLVEAATLINEILSRRDLEPRLRAVAFRILGDIEDRNGNYRLAFAAYAKAKEIQRVHHAAEFAAPGSQIYTAFVERLARYFEAAPAGVWSVAGRRPRQTDGAPAAHVFLVGFARTGTTLLEHALACHPQIVTTDEEDLLADARRAFFESDGSLDRLARAGEAELAPFRSAYWRNCSVAGPVRRGKIFIDKLPMNTISLAIIAKLFPDARIVFAIRDPRDVVLSCFRHLFTMNRAMYEFCTLEGSARLYDATMQVGQCCLEKSGFAHFEHRYEDMVSDFEGALRRLCEFLGVEWHEAIRDFAAKAKSRDLVTPSSFQVTRGLYDGSGQWRRYRDEMAEVLPILEPWVSRFGYPGA